MSLSQRQWEGGAVSFCLSKITQRANTEAKATVSSFTFEQMWFIWSQAKKTAHRGLPPLNVTANTFPIKYKKIKVQHSAERTEGEQALIND